MSRFNSVGKFFATVGSAINAASAVEGSRTPRARDLRALGINPADFNRIGRNY